MRHHAMPFLVMGTTPRRVLWEQAGCPGLRTFELLFCSSHLKTRTHTISGVLEVERGPLVGYHSRSRGARKERVVLKAS